MHSLETDIDFRLYYLTLFLFLDARSKILLQFLHIWVILGKENKSQSRMWCVLCNLLLLTSGRSGKIHIRLWQLSDSVPTFMFISYQSRKKSACLWFMVMDSEMPLMINYTALRFCCLLTYRAPTVKHINALCLARDKQLNLLCHKKW